MLDAVPCDGCGAALAEILALVPTKPVLALALVILIVVAGVDAARPGRGARR